MEKLLDTLYQLEEKRGSEELDFGDYSFLNKVNEFTNTGEFDELKLEVKKDIFYLLQKFYINNSSVISEVDIDFKKDMWLIYQEKYQNILERTVHGVDLNEIKTLLFIKENYYFLYTLLIYKKNLSFDKEHIYITQDGKEYTLKKENDNGCLCDYMYKYGIEESFLPDGLDIGDSITYTELIAKLFNKKICFAK